MDQNCTGLPLRPSTQPPWHCAPWLHTSEQASESGLFSKRRRPASSMRLSLKRETICGTGVPTGQPPLAAGTLAPQAALGFLDDVQGHGRPPFPGARARNS